MRYIPKYQGGTTGGGITNTKLTTDESAWWDTYNQSVLQRWKELSMDATMTPEKLNPFLQRLGQLRAGLKYDPTGKAIQGTSDYDVNAYQRDFHNVYKFGNNDSFWNGMQGSSNPVTETHDTKAAAGQTFTGDNYYGTQTDHRRANFFNTDELAQANEIVKLRGWQFVEDPNGISDGGRKSYILQTLPQNAGTPGNTGTLAQETPDPSKPTVKPNQLTFTPKPTKQRWPGWSDGMVLDSMLGNDLYNHRQQELLQAEMKFPKKTYSSPDYLMDNGYFTRSLLKNQANQIRANATRELSSNQEYNFALAGQAEDAASKLDIEGARIKADRTAQEKMNFQKILEQRKLGQTDAANFNASQSAAAWNNSLNATQKRLERDNASINSAMANKAVSFGEYLKTKRLNDNNLLRAQAKMQLSEQYNNRLKAYQADQDITKWKDFGGLYDAMMNAGGWGDDAEMSKWKRTWAEQKALDANQLAKVNSWLMTDAGAEWRTKWSDYLDQRQRQFYDEVGADQLAYNASIGQIPTYVTNQFGWYFPDNRRTISFQKSGGTIDRLSNFTKQYMQEQQHVRKSQDTRNQTLQRSLNQQLERLSREQLILLRSVFK